MAINLHIQKQLHGAARRRQRIELWSELAVSWAGVALVGMGILILERQSGWASSLVLPLVAVAGALAAFLVLSRRRGRDAEWGEIARRVESCNPELQGRLVTALEQQPGPGGRLNYLQQRLVDETLGYGRRSEWEAVYPVSILRVAQTAQWVALALFLVTLLGLRTTGGHQLLTNRLAQGVTVTPGDVSLERGSSLVVLARFTGALPPSVDLVFGQEPALQRLSLIKSLGDPMFGGSVPEVSSNLIYRVEYGGQRTRDFTLSVYEHPRLERADAELTFPAYTGVPQKRVENTRRLSAVQGSQVDLELKLNKPVASAQLVARGEDRDVVPLAIEAGAPKASLKHFALDSSKTYDLRLLDTEGRTNKVPAEFVFEALSNRTPELRLTSPRGDIRPSPLEELSFEGTVWDDFGVIAFGVAYVSKGKNPDFIELGRDVAGNTKTNFHHLLRLEDQGVKTDELVSWFVWADDLGPDGQVRRTMGDLYFGEVRPFEEVFREGQGMEGQGAGGQSGGEDRTGKLAELQKQIVNATWKLERGHDSSAGHGAKPPKTAPPARQANERSGDQSRNSATSSDLFFRLASLSRNRVVAGQVGRADPSGLSEAPRSSPSRKSTEPIPAKKGAPKYEDDASVLLDSQRQALEQAKEVLQGQRDPQSAGLWQKAVTEMETALARLEKATNSPAELKEALAAEQAAYQALIQLQAHEYQVSRSRGQGQSASSRNQQMQRQLDELDLNETENRYENQREAQRTQNPERREQLQMMSRLQELARRQQDLNQRLKELQTALQEARTEQEKAEVRRRLKRLQEEEQQMLADVDELRQRMDKSENQSRLADEKRQLDQTRQQVQQASDAANQGAVPQALAAGTRAQDQLQQLHDDLRKKSSSQFAEDLRQMRSQARELARQQENILKKIQENSSTERKSLSSGADQEETRAQLARQKSLMTNLVERATQVSQQAEEAEPVLSRQLYDTVRKFAQDSGKDLKEAESELLSRGPMTRSLFELLRENSEQGAPKLEELTSELLRQGFLPQASRVGERARSGIEQLKKGVERAAESVLGDDAEDLRLAQRQLDALSNQLKREITDGQTGSPSTNRALRASGSNTNESTQGQASQQQAKIQPGSSEKGPDQSGARSSDSPEGASSLSAQAQQGGQSSSEQRAGQQQAGQQQAGQQQAGQQQAGQQQAGQQQAGQQQAGQQQAGQQQAGQQQAGQQQAGQQQAGQQQAGQQQAGQQSGNPTAEPGENAAPSEAPGQTSALAGQPGRAQRGSPSQQRQEAPGAAAGGGGDPRETAAAGGARNFNWNQLLNESTRLQDAPITGEGFSSWSDQLREVEELIDEPDLRDDVAKARERARQFRQDFKRERKKPDWAVVQSQVMQPLTEVRDRIAEELARRDSREALVPLDRDPVPNRYSDLVRRYYEELGKQR